MSHYPNAIGACYPGGVAPVAQGRFAQRCHGWAWWHHAKCRQSSRRAATQVYSPSAVPQPSQSAPQRPAPAALERAGDLPGRLLRDYLSGWTSQYTEYDYYVPPEAVYGTIPEEIKGTLFLIGPGLTEVYGTSVRYPSDADGMVSSLAFGDGGQVFFRNRYVRTRSFATEQALGRRVTRGLNDRGAPVVTGQQPQQQHHHHHHRHHRHQQQQAEASSSGGGAATAVAGSGRSSGNGAVSSRAAADFDSEFDEEFDWDHRSGGGASGGAGDGRQSAAALTPTSAAGGAGARPLRLDPLALLGLPPLPPLSSLFNPIDTSFRAPANASIVLWGGRLLAFTEDGSLPYELNKLSLETVGQYDAAGAMADIGRIVGGYKIAPAPPQGPAGGLGPRPQRLVLMGTAQSGPDTLVRWAEVGEDGGLACPATTYRLPGCSAMGVLDFWVTERHYVVVQAPLDFNPQRFVTRAAIGAASFVECFDWDPSRPARIHLVARPTPASIAAAAAAASRPRGPRDPNVWPPKGPDAIMVDAPPLLPISCVGCYSLADDGRVLVLDAVCQQGLPGSHGGTLDSLDPEEHKRQPKPELTRLVVELSSGAATATATATATAAARATARVLSQRTIFAATTAAAFAAGSSSPTSAGAPPTAATAARAAAPPPLAPVGNGGSFRGGYHHLYTAASANDTAASWAPPQVLLKLSLPPEYGTPSAVTTASTAPATSGGAWAPLPPPAGLARRRGLGAEVWVPGDRVFVGPPVFVPRATSGDSAGSGAVLDGAGGGDSPAGRPLAEALGTGSPLPPLETEVEAAARRAAVGAAARRREEEQDGWLLVMVADVEAMVSELCILDARDVTRGPVAVVALPHHLPHVRHAHFTRSYCGPGLAAPPGWKPRGGVAAGPAAGEKQPPSAPPSAPKPK